MNDLIYGKIPPQAINIEESILGILLTQPNAMVQVSDILKPEMFYKDANILIYTVIDELHIKSYPIDIMTVSQELRNKGKLEEAGGVFYISELTNSEYGNIVYNSKIIVQKWMQREMIRISHETIKEAYEDITDVFDLIDKTSLQIVSISNRKQNNIKTVGYIKTKISKSILSGQPISECFSLGISGLDFMSKTFNVVAGYQGTGKTALMLTACKNLAKNKVKSGIMSIEMSDVMLVARLIQSDTRISSKKIVTNDLTEAEKELYFDQKESDYDNYIFVDDDCDVTDKNIISKIIAFVMKFGIKVLFLDFIQLIEIIRNGNATEVLGVEKLTRNLQNVAKQFDVSIIALSQLIRSTEVPTAKSLRGGGLEQAASDIIILYDEFWKENDGVAWKDIPEERRGKVKGIYAKGRYTEVENRDFYFDKPHQLYYDWNNKPETGNFLNLFKETKKEQFDIF